MQCQGFVFISINFASVFLEIVLLSRTTFIKFISLEPMHGRRPGAEFGGTKKFFRGPISGKMSIFRVKISYDLFLVIDLVLRIFPFFSHIFRMFTMLNVVYDHFLTRKPPFFTLFILSRTFDNTASQNIGGDQPMHGPSPTSNLGGP